MANHPQTEELILGYVQACQERDFARIRTFYEDDDSVCADGALGQVHVGIETTKQFYLTTMTGLR